MRKRPPDPETLSKLPFVSTRQICVLADCHPSTVSRSELVPVGVRGRTRMYKTSEALAWISGTLGAEANHAPEVTTGAKRSATTSADALARLAAIKGGAK